MCALMTWRNWLLFTIVCAGVSGYLAWQTWPILPLDTGYDAETMAVRNAALIAHCMKYALIGIGIPLLLLLVGRIACGKRRERM